MREKWVKIRKNCKKLGQNINVTQCKALKVSNSNNLI